MIQKQAHLLRVKRNVVLADNSCSRGWIGVQEPFDDATVPDRFFDNRAYIFWLHARIKDPLRLNHDDRTFFAKAVTARHPHGRLTIDRCARGGKHRLRAVRAAAGSAADRDARSRRVLGALELEAIVV